MQPQVGDTILVRVTKVTLGKDGKLYVTITCADALNRPALVWKE